MDTLAGAIIKRLSEGRRDGVAVIAEGLVLGVAPEDLAGIEDVERDAHGHLRLDEVNLGEILKAKVTERLHALGLRSTIAAKNIGYELRCADPIPTDMEYTRDLGYCAAKYLLAGGHAAMISMQGGHFVPIPFSEMLDPDTGRTRVRLVDTSSTRYAIARRYMIRLRRDDFEDPHTLAKLATTVQLSEPEFRRQFEHLVETEPPPLVFDLEGEHEAAPEPRLDSKPRQNLERGDDEPQSRKRSAHRRSAIAAGRDEVLGAQIHGADAEHLGVVGEKTHERRDAWDLGGALPDVLLCGLLGQGSKHFVTERHRFGERFDDLCFVGQRFLDVGMRVGHALRAGTGVEHAVGDVARSPRRMCAPRASGSV